MELNPLHSAFGLGISALNPLASRMGSIVTRSLGLSQVPER